MEYAYAEPGGSPASLEFFCLRLVGDPLTGRGSVLLADRTSFREACPDCAWRRR